MNCSNHASSDSTPIPSNADVESLHTFTNTHARNSALHLSHPVSDIHSVCLSPLSGVTTSMHRKNWKLPLKKQNNQHHERVTKKLPWREDAQRRLSYINFYRSCMCEYGGSHSLCTPQWVTTHRQHNSTSKQYFLGIHWNCFEFTRTLTRSLVSILKRGVSRTDRPRSTRSSCISSLAGSLCSGLLVQSASVPALGSQQQNLDWTD